jgi:hypothetical protein
VIAIYVSEWQSAKIRTLSPCLIVLGRNFSNLFKHSHIRSFINSIYEMKLRQELFASSSIFVFLLFTFHVMLSGLLISFHRIWFMNYVSVCLYENLALFQKYLLCIHWICFRNHRINLFALRKNKENIFSSPIGLLSLVFVVNCFLFSGRNKSDCDDPNEMHFWVNFFECQWKDYRKYHLCRLKY